MFMRMSRANVSCFQGTGGKKIGINFPLSVEVLHYQATQFVGVFLTGCGKSLQMQVCGLMCDKLFQEGESAFCLQTTCLFYFFSFLVNGLIT